MSHFSLKNLTEIAMMTALAIILDRLTIYQMPQGGSVTLVMLPLLLVSFRLGAKAGLLAGFLTGLIQLLFGGYFLNLFQVICDYLLAYTTIGLAGLIPLSKTKKALLQLSLASFLAGCGRLFWHVLAGIIFYADYAPKGTPVWLYSLTYNASFMVPSTLITLAVLVLLFYRLPSFFKP